LPCTRASSFKAMQGTLAVDWLQAAINAGLALDPEMQDKLRPMTGRVICIRIKLIERELFLFPHEQGITVETQYDGTADTTLTGTPMALLKMGLSKQTAPMLLKGEISIEGDTHLGREFKKVLASLDIDWEELAAKWIGDAPAHQLFKTLSSIQGWGKKSARSVADDVSEYLQEESRDVVSGAELNYFYQQVDDLRDAVARIEKDISQLTSSNGGTKE
jgi:ubiquinone biosynthesis protein UbiJ